MEHSLPPRAPTPLRAWGETAALTLLGLAAGRFLEPADPFLLSQPFPWLVLIPLVAGLQHGVAPGVGSAGAIIAALAFSGRLGLTGAGRPFPLEAAVGLIAVGMLAGEFTAVRRRRLNQLGAIAEYQSARLENLARTLHLLRTSHDRLERLLPPGLSSLRAALDAARRRCRAASPDASAPERARQILELLAPLAQIEAASLHPVSTRGRVEAPLARVGSGPEVSPSDPLLAEAIHAKRLMSVASRRDEAGEVLVAVPLVDVQDQVHAVVAVTAMPFGALHEDNLRLLAIVAGQLADSVPAGAPLDGANARRAFVLQVRRWAAEASSNRLPLSLARLRVWEGGEELLQTLLSASRGLDVAYASPRTGDFWSAWVLLPLTEERGATGYRRRIEALAGAAGGRVAVDAMTMREGDRLAAQWEKAITARSGDAARNGTGAPDGSQVADAVPCS